MVVLDAEAGENVDAAVIHLDWYRNHDDLVGSREANGEVVLQLEHVGSLHEVVDNGLKCGRFTEDHVDGRDGGGFLHSLTSRDGQHLRRVHANCA